MSEKAFSFLPMPERSSKPRKNGLTMCLDQGMGLTYTEDLLSICSEYVDVWKLGWATAQLQPKEIVSKKVELIRNHDISVCNGGTLLELSEHQGKAEQLFSELLDLGCDSTEISSGSLDIDSDRVAELISLANKMGLRVFCEVGKKLPEDDPNNVIFEAPRKSQQIFFLRQFGPEANLGNVHPTDVISLETLRRGLRGDTINDFYFVIGDRHLKKQGRK